MILHDNAHTRAIRRHADAVTVRSAYRRDPDAFDCMGRVFGWPLFISAAMWIVGIMLYHAANVR